MWPHSLADEPFSNTTGHEYQLPVKLVISSLVFCNVLHLLAHTYIDLMIVFLRFLFIVIPYWLNCAGIHSPVKGSGVILSWFCCAMLANILGNICSLFALKLKKKHQVNEWLTYVQVKLTDYKILGFLILWHLTPTVLVRLRKQMQLTVWKKTMHLLDLVIQTMAWNNPR